ncbi:DUF2958 domain-containing protein [Streptomyces sp. NPDC020681]|uniref:DUF2958 domain-containing protein n=1 Tax=Streptomyces sp. NPDC020681 TaxID=3365083 RepID=UPI00378EA752
MGHEQQTPAVPDGVTRTLPAETQRQRRGHDFYPSPAALAAVPPMYSTDGVKTAEKVVHLHYFVGGCDWFVTELDRASGTAFGWAQITEGGGEWGLFSLPELERISVSVFVVERDLGWEPKPARQVELIAAAARF